jgi:hypothetical protein
MSEALPQPGVPDPMCSAEMLLESALGDSLLLRSVITYDEMSGALTESCQRFAAEPSIEANEDVSQHIGYLIASFQKVTEAVIYSADMPNEEQVRVIGQLLLETDSTFVNLFTEITESPADTFQTMLALYCNNRNLFFNELAGCYQETDSLHELKTILIKTLQDGLLSDIKLFKHLAVIRAHHSRG